MFFTFFAQIYLDFGIELPYILRVTAQETEELVKIVFMGLFLEHPWFQNGYHNPSRIDSVLGGGKVESRYRRSENGRRYICRDEVFTISGTRLSPAGFEKKTSM
jgi:hypothetical protein